MKHEETHLYKLSTILYEEKMCLTYAIVKGFQKSIGYSYLVLGKQFLQIL